MNNNIMFVPPINNSNSSAASVIMSAGGGSAGGHFLAGSPPHLQHHSNLNASAAIYHMRHIANYHHHQQQQRFMGHHSSQSPPQRSGFSYFHQGPRHFYNPMMNQRPPAPPNANNQSYRGNYNGMWNNRVQSQSYQQTQKPKTDVTANKTLAKTSTQKASITSSEQENPDISASVSTGEQNKQIAMQRPQQQQQQSQKTDRFDKTLNKKVTKFPIIKRSDSKSSLKSSTTVVVAAATVAATTITTSTCVKVISKEFKQRDQSKNNDDTMQRNSSKASHTSSSSTTATSSTTAAATSSTATTTKSHHQQHTSANAKNHIHDSSDSGISTGHGHHHHYGGHSNATSAKQRKSRGSSKRQDGAANNNNTTNPVGQPQKRGGNNAAYTVNDWLQNDNMYCYERRFISSCGEDNVISSRHNPAHRNSTSSEAAGSDDLNSSSSNEDLCPTYIIQTKTTKKSAKSRQKRQQKRKQPCNATGNGVAGTTSNIGSSDLQPMDIDEDYKENRKPQGTGAGGKQQSTTAAINLRKQCTKAAALKAVLNNSKLNAKCSGNSNALTTSPSNSSVCSSLSSASSTTSINSSSLSSSASSSPANSANSSPTASPTVSKRNAEHLKKVAQALVPPLRQFTKLNLNESEMVQQMRRYIIDPSLLRVYGFPVESVHHENCIEIYKCLPKHLAEEAVTKDNQRHHRHFYGRKKTSGVINAYDGLSGPQQWYTSAAHDSGHGSGDSSPRFTDSDSSEMGEDDLATGPEPIMAFYTPDGVYQIFSEYDNSIEKQCVRCSKMFQVNEEGEYITTDSCTYHWGKLSNVYNGKCYVNIHACCQGEENSLGCGQHTHHVWNGAVVGINGPYNDFVHTKPRNEKQKHKTPKIYAIDCEMSYTGLGLEVTKVSVVAYDGSLVYEHFVKPQAEIVDYNTRFSGISEKDLSPNSNNSIKTFAQVRQDLLKLFDADTILIGHGLDNDLRVLRLVHKTIVDTSLIFSHSTGYPYRRSLKNLTKSFLKRDIQCSDLGHSSFEDSRACLELMLWKVRKDLRHWSYQ